MQCGIWFSLDCVWAVTFSYTHYRPDLFWGWNKYAWYPTDFVYFKHLSKICERCCVMHCSWGHSRADLKSPHRDIKDQSRPKQRYSQHMYCTETQRDAIASSNYNNMITFMFSSVRNSLYEPWCSVPAWFTYKCGAILWPTLTLHPTNATWLYTPKHFKRPHVTSKALKHRKYVSFCFYFLSILPHMPAHSVQACEALFCHFFCPSLCTHKSIKPMKKTVFFL